MILSAKHIMSAAYLKYRIFVLLDKMIFAQTSSVMKKITRALISVSDKTGLTELAQELRKLGVEIYSTGGTLRSLHEAGIEATSIESYTEFPEMLDGRVKTLHPKIHGGILARREEKSHMEDLDKHGILTFDLVIINLYPFEKVLQKDSFSFEEAIENIDIGGPSMIRAASKNYRDVAVVVAPEQYSGLIERLKENDATLSEEYRFELMVMAFERTSSYDAIISGYLHGLQGENFPQNLTLSYRKAQELRYGENPHQKGGFYVPALQEENVWKQLHGKELSYNNLLDLDVALRMSKELPVPGTAIFKHNNPCGVSVFRDQKENLDRAMKADPVSYFGGIVVQNEPMNAETATLIGEQFMEIVVAPSYSKEAFEILSKKKNIRIIEVPDFADMRLSHFEIKSAAGGFLLQESDFSFVPTENWKQVTKAGIGEKELNDLAFAFLVVKHVKSNAIVLVKDGQTIGIGAGQMNRVGAMRIAIENAKRSGFDVAGSYLASDAFFPFRDNVDFAVEAGVKAIVQPGGSIKDADSIQAADEAGIAMYFTDMRHFRH